VLPQSLFIKTFNYEDGLAYPDMGSNFETFTKDDFIELESLSPLKQLAPGESIAHTESWHLFGIDEAHAAAQLSTLNSQPSSATEAALAQWLAPYLSKIGIPDRSMNLCLLSACLALLLTLTGCQTASMQGIQSSRMAMTDAIGAKSPVTITSAGATISRITNSGALSGGLASRGARQNS
jgi:hypothetical protein